MKEVKPFLVHKNPDEVELEMIDAVNTAISSYPAYEDCEGVIVTNVWSDVDARGDQRILVSVAFGVDTDEDDDLCADCFLIQRDAIRFITTWIAFKRDDDWVVKPLYETDAFHSIDRFRENRMMPDDEAGYEQVAS